MRLWFSFQFRSSWSTFPHVHTHASADGGPRGLLHAQPCSGKVKNAKRFEKFMPTILDSPAITSEKIISHHMRGSSPEQSLFVIIWLNYSRVV